MKVGTITQNGFNLIHDIETIPLQHSADVSITFVKDAEYTGYAAVPSIGFYDGSIEKVMEMPLADDSTFNLPAEVFKDDGEIAIAVALSNDTETIVAGTVCLYVQKAPGGMKILPSDNTWEPLVISIMNQYNAEVITPKIDDLMADVKEQQDIVDNKMSDLDVMVSSGAFDGSYWLSGIGVPVSEIGRDRDWYIDLDTDRWKVYRKDGDAWTDTGTYMRGADGSMGGDTVPVGSIVHFTGTSTEPGWLVCDGSEVSRKEYSKLFEVIGTSYGEGDGSKTFNLPDEPNPITYQQLENGAIQFEDRVPGVKVIIKARQDVPIVAKLENDLTSNSKTNAPNVYAVRNALNNLNLLINGDFRIWQCGTTFDYQNATISKRTYSADGWFSGGGAKNFIITKGVNGGARIQHTTAGTYFELSQMIECGEDYKVGDTLTLSMEIKSNVNFTAIQRIGSDGAHNVRIDIEEGTHVYIKTYTLNENSIVNGRLFFGALFGNLDIFDITVLWVKAEPGGIATPNVPRPLAEEWMLCQFLCQKYMIQYTANNLVIGMSIEVPITFPKMRVVPTCVDFVNHQGPVSSAGLNQIKDNSAVILMVPAATRIIAANSFILDANIY